MTAALDDLCARVAALRDAPDDVLALSRARVVAAAGAARAGSSEAMVGAAATTLAESAARLGWDDPVLGGRTGLAGPYVAMEQGCTVREILLASVIADEVGGRVGLLALHGEHGAGLDLLAPACGAAAASAWLRGESPSGVRRAILRAANLARRLDGVALRRAPGLAGREAVTVAASAVDAEGALDTALAARTTRPVWGALAGVGEVWLTRTLWVRRMPGPLFGAVALEALDEILRRHVKAADKRLRADQVDAIELRVAQPAWLEQGGDEGATHATVHDLAACAAALVQHHALGAVEVATLDDHATLAERVQVRHDWALTVVSLGQLGEALGPLFGGAAGLVAAAGDVRARGQWPGIGGAELAPLLRIRPDRALRGFLGPEGDLRSANLTAWQWRQPTLVRLYTTRGGAWPERRAVPAGVGADRLEVARARHAHADALFALPLDASGADWRAVALA